MEREEREKRGGHVDLLPVSSTTAPNFGVPAAVELDDVVVRGVRQLVVGELAENALGAESAFG